ncbi:hypothetical protein [Aquibium sp. ELW1220]|uniref:hypothetical protein n=1 Tax=Aquibium sp. ELW1220 TaxID=2976766 RepID=UPI0025B19386|nr:hypothetical protein [Aquibium sp. ELW1220]MDN2582713.1 hypothetical protein [Aquibium sp. ELW1220]
MLLDFLGGMVLTAVAVVNLNALLSALAVARRTRLLLAAVVGLWVGLQISLATAGVFASQLSLTVPFLGLAVIAPVVAVGLAAWRSAAVRAALLALPMPLLVGLHAGRILGVFFLLLAASDRLGGPFPQAAGWGDIAVGVLALPLAAAIARGTASPASIEAWNVLGALDLVLALTLGILSTNGFVLQAISAGAGSAAMAQLPWSLIPTVLVPFYLIVHGIVFAQLRQARQANNAPQTA